ncbi:uncharacterized protein [Nicotiana sylvestris]|uniref:uncharacterized protein n=1 Tax=Nicotiana sylvestris TaxID=4096 RepID=UPI00388C3618
MVKKKRNGKLFSFQEDVNRELPPNNDQQQTRAEKKMKVTEMRMLMWMWMCGHTRMDNIRNDDIREMVHISPIDDKKREARLKWFGHVQRRSPDAPVRRCERLVMEGTRRGKRRPKKYWGEVIRHDMARLQISEDMTLDRKLWRSSIKVVG